MNWIRKQIERVILWALGYSYLPFLEKEKLLHNSELVNKFISEQPTETKEEPKNIFIPYHDIRVPKKSSRR